MTKKIMLILCLFLLVGCKNMDTDNEITDEEIKVKYDEMENKLFEYGKSFYDNNDLSSEDQVVTITLNDLNEIYDYDISMFVNPKTGEQCNLDETQIEFYKSEKDDLEYNINPIVICSDDDLEEYSNNRYGELNETFNDYLFDVYDKMVENNENTSGTYTLTLNEFKNKGYDISMFINSNTLQQCSLDETYVEFTIGENGKIENINFYYSC